MKKDSVKVTKPSAAKVAQTDNNQAVKVLPSVMPLQLVADIEQQNSGEVFYQPSHGKINPSSPFQLKSSNSNKFTSHSLIQRKSSSNWAFSKNSVGTNSNSISPIQRVAAPTNKTGLPDNVKSGVEQLSGVSLNDVKVHYNSPKPAQLHAHAYAQGSDIHVASGQEKHVPHEAWHVVQQKQGRVKATTQMKGKVPVNDDAGLENEADIMGAKAVQIATSVNSGLIQNKSISNNTDVAQLGAWNSFKRRFGFGKSDEDLKKEEDEKKKNEEQNQKADYKAIDFNKTDEKVDDAANENLDMIDTVGETSATVTDMIEGGEDGDFSRKEFDGGEVEDKTNGGLGAAFYTFGLINSVIKLSKDWDGKDVWEKTDGVIDLAASSASLAGDIAGTVNKVQEAGEEGSGVAADFASNVGAGLGDSLTALKDGVNTIHEIYKAYQLFSRKDIKASTSETISTSLKVVKGLVSTAGKTVNSIISISKIIGSGAGPLAQVVPGLGLALSAVDIAIGTYDLIKAKVASGEMELLLKNQQKIEENEAKKQALTPDELKDKKNADEIKLITYLKGINDDKQKKLSIDLGLSFVSLIGNILSCIPEPASQIAGLSLKIIGEGGKMLHSFIGWVQGKANDAVASDEKANVGKAADAKTETWAGSIGKFFGGNAEESSDKTTEKNKELVKYIAKQIQAMNSSEEIKPENIAGLKANSSKIEPLISAAGTEPNEFFRTIVDEKDFSKGLKLIYTNLSA
jgi:hypothetical protein